MIWVKPFRVFKQGMGNSFFWPLTRIYMVFPVNLFISWPFVLSEHRRLWREYKFRVISVIRVTRLSCPKISVWVGISRTRVFGLIERGFTVPGFRVVSIVIIERVLIKLDFLFEFLLENCFSHLLIRNLLFSGLLFSDTLFLQFLLISNLKFMHSLFSQVFDFRRR